MSSTLPMSVRRSTRHIALSLTAAALLAAGMAVPLLAKARAERPAAGSGLDPDLG
jgi:hypothetical protein